MRQLAALGLLKPEDSSRSELDLIEVGLQRMLDKTPLGSIDESYDCFYACIRANGGFGVSVWDICMYHRLALKTVLSRIGLKSKAAEWAAYVLNHHNGFSSTSMWSTIIQDLGGGSEKNGDWVDDDDEVADGPVATKRKNWLETMKAKFPWLFRYQYKSTLFEQFTSSLEGDAPARLAEIHRRDHALAAIFEQLVKGMNPPTGIGEPYAVVIWELGDPTCHAWDYVEHCFQEGIYDASQNMLLDRGFKSLAEAKSGLAEINLWLQPVVALIEWDISHATRN